MSKIILTNEVSGLGSAGDVVEVKNGYARNYLLPRGFAVIWSKGGEKQVSSIRAARDARQLATIEEAQTLKARLEEGSVKLSVKAGVGGRLFGSVKTADIAAAVAEAGIGQIDKRKVEIPNPIRSVGEYLATVRLHGDLVATIKLKVVAKK
jgi:large subunit ribosomal protein L9